MNFLKRISFSLLGLLLVVLIAATIVEKTYDTSFALEYIYHSQGFVALWILLVISSMAYIFKRGMYRRPYIFFMHISFIVILTGALFTHLLSEEGSLHLRKGTSVSAFIDKDGMGHKFPFSVSLDCFKIEYYSSSQSPSDYISKIEISDKGQAIKGNVSMNEIFQYNGYRFYQAGYDEDECGTTLLISHDPIGISITYIGYALLFLAMLLFLFSSKNHFRELIKSPLLKKVALILLLLVLNPFASYSSINNTVSQKETAARLNRVCVMYNGRIAPMQTLMEDCLLKIYGSSSYKGYSASQVFTGFLTSPKEWEREKIIKIKDKGIRSVLNIDGKYASLNDFFDAQGNDKLGMSDFEDKKLMRAVNEAEEKASMLYLALNGELLKIFPCCDNNSLCWTYEDDEYLNDADHRRFKGWLTEIRRSVAGNDIKSLDRVLLKIEKYQKKVAADMMPATTKIDSEILYNSLRNHAPVAMVMIALGIIAFVYFGIQSIKEIEIPKIVDYLLNAILLMAFVYITILIVLRWYISSHIPLSNGFETMQFTSWCFILLTLLIQRKFKMILSFGLILSGLALMVSTFGETNPQITNLMPVLSSPLLSVHVVVIMISYSLFAFMMLNGIMAFIMKYLSHDCNVQIERLRIISNILLYPALFLLTAGIFIGAIWANVSWGSYWGWDPKEVWALITMLIYSLALHQESLPLFKRTMFFHLFSIIAFLTVLITYFGVNFILGGMHSYA